MVGFSRSGRWRGCASQPWEPTSCLFNSARDTFLSAALLLRGELGRGLAGDAFLRERAPNPAFSALAPEFCAFLSHRNFGEAIFTKKPFLEGLRPESERVEWFLQIRERLWARCGDRCGERGRRGRGPRADGVGDPRGTPPSLCCSKEVSAVYRPWRTLNRCMVAVDVCQLGPQLGLWTAAPSQGLSMLSGLLHCITSSR